MKSLLILLPLVVCTFVISCKESAEDKKKDAAEIAKEAAEDPEAAVAKIVEMQALIANKLEGITDKESAEKAIEELKPITAELGAFMKALPEEDDLSMSEEREEKLKEKIETSADRLQDAQMKLLAALKDHPELLQKIGNVLANTGEE